MTQNISLTSNQGDIIIVPYFDLFNAGSQRRFSSSISALSETMRKFDNGVVTKSF